MKHRRHKVDERELKTLCEDAVLQMVAEGLIPNEQPENKNDVLPTGWQTQGRYRHEFNRNGYTGNVIAA